jgi:SAM-dependent methyltransferase
LGIYAKRDYNLVNVRAGSGSQRAEDLRHQRQIIERVSDWATETKPGVTFDVGAARGGLAKALKAAGYENVVAIEPALDTVELMRKEGIDAHVGSAENLPALGLSPGLAIYSHVVEHLLEPQKAIVEIRDMLAPSGLIYVEVPNAALYPFEDQPYAFLYLEHVSHFTKSSLKYLLESKGFEILRLENSDFENLDQAGLSQKVISAVAKLEPVAIRNAQASTMSEPKCDPALIKEGLDGILAYLDWSREHPAMRKLEELAKSGKPIWIWGISQLAMMLLGQEPLKHANIQGLVDRDPSKQQRKIHGKPILPPETLKKLGKGDTVLLMPYGLEHSMLSYLKEIGFQGQAVPLRTD